MKILVYLTGSLGDTLASLPALWALREHFNEANITLLSDVQIDRNLIRPREVLGDSNIVDAYLNYPSAVDGSARIRRMIGLLRLRTVLKRHRFDALVYLVRVFLGHRRIYRDFLFFKSAGIPLILAREGMLRRPRHQSGVLPRLPSQADQFLARLSASGIPVPPSGEGRTDLALTTRDEEPVKDWLRHNGSDASKPWIAFAPGSKMPCKVWPENRFAQVGEGLIGEYDMWPVVFGGPEDRPVGDRLIAFWGRGYNAAGELGIRPAAVALRRCSLYIGNDTGTMHLAAAVGTRCVAIFSSRDFPGAWDPYGQGHVVLRTDPSCAGCMLVECKRMANLCLGLITVEQVIKACETILSVADQNRCDP